jgi:hypothetical protein
MREASLDWQHHQLDRLHDGLDDETIGWRSTQRSWPNRAIDANYPTAWAIGDTPGTMLNELVRVLLRLPEEDSADATPDAPRPQQTAQAQHA